jgi:hypothetical protein
MSMAAAISSRLAIRKLDLACACCLFEEIKLRNRIGGVGKRGHPAKSLALLRSGVPVACHQVRSQGC